MMSGRKSRDSYIIGTSDQSFLLGRWSQVFDHELPMYSESAEMEDLGISIVEESIRGELHWIFRRQEKRDLGIDALIEIIDEERRSKGRMLALQIKCGKSFFEERTSDGFVFRGEKKHFLYWTNHSLPVILLLCHPLTRDCYWVEVARANTVILDNSWKIIVPVSNKLSQVSKEAIEAIANQLRHEDIIELSLFRFLHEKYNNDIEICTELDLPRDFHGLSYLAKIRDEPANDIEMVMIGFHYDFKNNITVDDLNKYIELYYSNMKHLGWNKYYPNTPMHLFLVSESKTALDLNNDIKNFLKQYDFLVYHRLLYKPRFYYSLDDLD